MRVLVTGGTGQLGRRLIPRLAGSNDLLAITRREPPDDIAGPSEWVRHDLAQPFENDLLPDSIDAVIHLAQSERYRDFPEGAADVFAVNVQSTFRLLEYARLAGARTFVLASTGGVYKHQSKPIVETAPLGLDSPYFRSKRIAELLLENYAQLFSTVVLRFFFIYGPGPSEMLIPRLAAKILAGEEIVVEGDPGLRMNPIFVEDAAAAVQAALDLEQPAVVNVAGNEVVSVTELIQRLATALGREPRLRHSESAEQEDLVADADLLRSVLGVRPETSLERGLGEVARSLATRVRD